MYHQICRRICFRIFEVNPHKSSIEVCASKFIVNLKSIQRNYSTKRNGMDTSLGKTLTMPTVPLPSSPGVNGKLIRFDNIAKSAQDSREYRGLKLENGLKVLLISDPTTDKAAAAITVDVGHMSDPDHIPGLAHFCEHMLFLGTEKYPSENEYSTYLSENGGTSNAATYADTTKYYFDVVPGKLEGALDRFSQFFIAPLFTESATEREINAVNSEHDKNIAIDVWRIRQVNKMLVDQKHPYSKFGTGNIKTLSEIPKEKGINVRDELIKFHSKWYSSNIMCLSVFGKETLDDLESMVVAKFSPIVNKNVEASTWINHPMLEEHYGTKISIVPVKDSRTLTISFPTGDLNPYYKSSPEHYLSHLIGHEGKGSILSELKSRGWCNNLVSGHSHSARGFGFFDVMVDLTQEGFDQVDEILKIIFEYLHLIKQEGPKEWIFREYCNLNEMQFRFKDKENPVSLVGNVVHHMQIYPLEEVLSAPYILTEWKPDLIQNLVNGFTPEKCRVILVGQKLEPNCKLTEQWYGTKYNYEKIPPATLAMWSECCRIDSLQFPEPNVFIPTDFTLLPIENDVGKFPVVIHDTSVVRVWHKQDTDYMKPKTIMHFDFTSPLAYSDPLNCNLTHMFVHLFRDQLNEYLYTAELAGLRLGVANTANGISLSISGYSHKQRVLLEKVLDQLFNFHFEDRRFDILKEQLSRALTNFRAEQPYQHAVYFLALLMTEQAWTKEELIDAISLLSVDRLRNFIKDFLSRMHVECLIHGNTNKEKTMEVSTLIEQKLLQTNSNTLPLLSRQLLLKREHKLRPTEHYLFETESNYHKSSCCQIYLQCGMQSNRANVMVDLVAQILSEPCYNVLRTKEQLGYIVFCGTRKANGVQGLRFIVQSAKHPSEVEERIELFITSMVESLEKLTDEEFDRHKEALAAQKLEKPKRLAALFNRFLNEISLQQYHFERPQEEVAYLKTVTKDDLIKFYKEYVVKSGLKRQALSIHIVSTVEGGAGYESKNLRDLQSETGGTESNEIESDGTIRKPIRITDLAVFKSSKELYPLVKPYINIQPKGAKSKL